MAKGQTTIVNSEPLGRFEECIISGTPKPGFLMEQTNAAPVGGRFTYQACQRADGVKGPVAVLLADSLQGKIAVGTTAAYTGGPPTTGDAYVSGTRGFLYWPVAGEELNLVVKDVSGTADDVAIGDYFMADGTNHGYIKANSAGGSAPFKALETVTDPTADYVLWVQYMGNAA